MSEHTPGPCQMSGGPCDGEPTELYENVHIGPYALCKEHAQTVQATPVSRRLIAAAPELLEAVKRLTDSLADEGQENFIGYDECLAAIAKTEG